MASAVKIVRQAHRKQARVIWPLSTVGTPCSDSIRLLALIGTRVRQRREPAARRATRQAKNPEHAVEPDFRKQGWDK